MHILIGIDDTDNLDSIGTGEVLENLSAALVEAGLGQGGFVTRHQLYIHEDIPYTSHNSAMCCAMEAEKLDEVIHFCRDYMHTFCAPGSDPGLCIVDLDKLRYKKRIIRFGHSAKTRVITKSDAMDMVALYKRAIYLSEHGGTGGGVIGALAGCGLRLSGFDGKIKGKIAPLQTQPVITVETLCKTFSLGFAMDAQRNLISPSDTVWLSCPTKAVYWDHQAAIYLEKDQSGRAAWRVYNIQELKGLVV